MFLGWYSLAWQVVWQEFSLQSLWLLEKELSACYRCVRKIVHVSMYQFYINVIVLYILGYFYFRFNTLQQKLNIKVQ